MKKKISRAKRPRLKTKLKKKRHHVSNQLELDLWQTRKKNYSSPLMQKIVNGITSEALEKVVSIAIKPPALYDAGIGFYNCPLSKNQC